MSDPFLRRLSELAATSRIKATNNDNKQNNAINTNASDEEQTNGLDNLHTGGDARGMLYLQMLAQQYQQRIESVLSYLDDLRFGRQTGSSIEALQKSTAELQADVRSLESEWATWMLLQELKKADDTITDEPVPPSLNERYSQQLLANRIVAQPGGPLGRALRILNWLEELQVFLLRIEESGSVTMKSSFRRLQRSTVGDAQKDFLDPDIELRLKSAGILPVNAQLLEKQDHDEEQRLLEYVWQLIRAGRLSESIQLCRTYQQHWRAASLQGGERLHDDGQLQQDGTVFRVGNPHHLLWRHACRKLSQAPGVSPIEASIYGLLGGDLQTAVKYSGQYKYEDALYCYLRVMIDEQVDEFIRAENKQDPMAARIPKAERSVPLDPTLDRVLSSLESSLNPLLTPSVSAQATGNPYIRLQKCLMLNDIVGAEAEMVQTIRTAYRGPTHVPSLEETHTVNHTYVLFAVHLYLYLHPNTAHGEPLNEVGSFLVHTYLSYLEAHPQQHSLVSTYAKYLSSSERVGWYIRFLRNIPSLTARQALLADLAQTNPENSLEITTRLVQHIIGDEEKQQQQQQVQQPTSLLLTSGVTSTIAPSASLTVSNLLASGTSSSGVTQSDLDKISSIDCFALQGPHVELAVVQEALIQATGLYRSFILREKYGAAKRFAQHLAEKQWDHAIFQCTQAEEQKKTILPPLWHSLDREYGHWRLYIKCLNWYEAWMTQHSTQPKKPTFQPNSYANASQAKAEYAMFAIKYERYEKELEEWKETQRTTVISCVRSFMELLECDGGWLNPIDVALRANELNEIRLLCIPRLVTMIMQICRESEQPQLCLPFADVLASPLHNLHSCFTAEQLQALMRQFRAAYIEVYINKHPQQDEMGE